MDLRDFDVEKPPDSNEPPRSPYPWALVIIGVVIVLGVVGYMVWSRRSPDSAAPAAGRDAPSTARDGVPPKPLGGPGDGMPLPPLDETDPVVRTLVQGLSNHPTIAAWLTTDNLIRSFTAAVHNVAAGANPTAHARQLAPTGPFRVIEGNGAHIDPRSYGRYDRIGDAVASVEAAKAAGVYSALKPRIEEAHAEQGVGGTFDASLERAIVELLETPVIDGPIALVPKGVGYAFADPRLEQLTPPQKQLLRMGPRNARRIQAKLREIGRELGIPEERLPSTPTTS